MITLFHAPRSRSSRFIFLLEEVGAPYEIKIVKIRRGDFTTFTRQRAVAPPTCEARTVTAVACELLARWLAGNPGTKLRLLGVVLTELTPASQLPLFEPASFSPCT